MEKGRKETGITSNWFQKKSSHVQEMEHGDQRGSEEEGEEERGSVPKTLSTMNEEGVGRAFITGR